MKPDTRQTIELRDCTIYVTQHDHPYAGTNRLGTSVSIRVKRGGHIQLSQTGNPMSGHAEAIYAEVHGPLNGEG